MTINGSIKAATSSQMNAATSMSNAANMLSRVDTPSLDNTATISTAANNQSKLDEAATYLSDRKAGLNQLNSNLDTIKTALSAAQANALQNGTLENLRQAIETAAHNIKNSNGLNVSGGAQDTASHVYALSGKSGSYNLTINTSKLASDDLELSTAAAKGISYVAGAAGAVGTYMIAGTAITDATTSAELLELIEFIDDFTSGNMKNAYETADYQLNVVESMSKSYQESIDAAKKAGADETSVDIVDLIQQIVDAKQKQSLGAVAASGSNQSNEAALENKNNI